MENLIFLGGGVIVWWEGAAGSPQEISKITSASASFWDDFFASITASLDKLRKMNRKLLILKQFS